MVINVRGYNRYKMYKGSATPTSGCVQFKGLCGKSMFQCSGFLYRGNEWVECVCGVGVPQMGCLRGWLLFGTPV